MVKKNKLTVSIIVRGKNESNWLKILLPQLKKQTLSNFEIIFCDNNSEDNTLEILKKYKIKKILTFKDYLPGKILNSAIKIASGEYICILSAHCIPVSKHWLQQHVDFIEGDVKYSAVYGKQIPLPGTSIQNLIDLDIIFKDQKIVYSKDPYLNNANSIYRANILKNNLFDPVITNIEDREWANRIVKKGYKVCYSAKSEVYHLHGIHQHNHETTRALNTYNIMRNKYLTKWKKCEFINKKHLKFCLIINARREQDITKLKKKTKIFLKKINTNKDYINKKIMITNFKELNHKNLETVKSKDSLKEDLKFIYKKFKKGCVDWNFIIYVNISEKINFNNIEKLIHDTAYNSRESSTFGEKIKENFLINVSGQQTFKSTNLDKVANKPAITLIKLSKGSVVSVDYLRQGLLVSNNTYIKCQ